MSGDASQILLLLVLGAMAAADTAAFGQFMIGQPLAAGWLAGVIVGEPAAGLLMGGTLAMLWSRLAPVGAATYPDVGPATVGGVGLLVFRPAPGVADALIDWPARLGFQRLPAGWSLDTPALVLLFGIGLALLAGGVGQRLVVAMRRFNADLGRHADEAARRGDFRGVERANRQGLFRAMTLGAGQTGAVLLAGWLVANVLLTRLPDSAGNPNPGVHLLWWTGLAALGTSLWAGARRDWAWIVAGVLIGLLFLRVS